MRVLEASLDLKFDGQANLGGLPPLGVMYLDVDTKDGKDGPSDLRRALANDHRTPSEFLEDPVAWLRGRYPTQRSWSGGWHFLMRYPVARTPMRKPLGKGTSIECGWAPKYYLMLEPSVVREQGASGTYAWEDDPPPPEEIPEGAPWLLEVLLKPEAATAGAERRSDPAPDTQVRSKWRAYAALGELDPDLADDYDTWVQVGQALHSIDPEDAGLLELWDAWSQQSDKHEAGNCTCKWAGFRKDGGVSVGTLVHLARTSTKSWEGLPSAPASWPKAETPLVAPLGEADSEPPASTDMGNARRLVALHGDDLFWTPERGWLVWTGPRFEPDALGAARERAKSTALSILDEAAAAGDTTKRDALLKHAYASQESRRLSSMLSVAQTDPGIAARIESFDSDPYLFNVTNGTIDLRTGRLQPHRRCDRITRLAPVAFDAQARAPRWRSFIEEVLPDSEVRAFVQRMFGYALCGDAVEQILPVLYGSGANGKSTLVEGVRAALGDYGWTAPFSALMPRRPGSVPNDIASLMGRRLVVAQEPDEGSPLSESTVKLLTGRDRVPARFMRQEWFEFMPSHTLLVTCNHLPDIRGTDDGIWRRVYLIPFEVTIPPERQDTGLGTALLEELSGILTWCVRGHMAWHAEGLNAPASVMAATRDYRADSDHVAAFVGECCRTDVSNARVSATDLRSRYVRWCEENGELCQSAKKVGARLAGLGFRSVKSSRRFWVGLAIVDDSAGETDRRAAL